MTQANGSSSSPSGSSALKAQIQKLERLDHQAPVAPALEAFDAETEGILGKFYGEAHRYLEAYKYASLAEAEALVNLPESAQEPIEVDRPKTGIQQRRQTLLGILTDMQEMEGRETGTGLQEEREEQSRLS